MKRIVIIGSTGSIGHNVLDVVSRHSDRFQIIGLGARSSVSTLREQAVACPSAILAVTDDAARETLTRSDALSSRVLGPGPGALSRLITETSPDLVVNAVMGFAGLKPTMTALEMGIPVAIANKESIITGGHILQEAARKNGAQLIPIDSEHVAISQCLRGAKADEIEGVTITASGGSMRDYPLAQMASASVEEVLARYTWVMGPKITVDSATLVNKGLEIIEAHWLFDLAYDQIDVVIHPQSVVHSFVRFIDGSIVSQMGIPDMRLPILYALSYPDRISSELRDDIAAFPDLTFSKLDPDRYPCFALVMAAARAGGNAPTVLNAANEVAVEAFLAGEIPYTRIQEIIAGALNAVAQRPITSLDGIIETDRETRLWIGQQMSFSSRSGDSQIT